MHPCSLDFWADFRVDFVAAVGLPHLERFPRWCRPDWTSSREASWPVVSLQANDLLASFRKNFLFAPPSQRALADALRSLRITACRNQRHRIIPRIPRKTKISKTVYTNTENDLSRDDPLSCQRIIAQNKKVMI